MGTKNMHESQKPVCLILGAGAGIGGTVAARFANAGYHAVLCRRSDQEGLNTLVENIRANGGHATGMLINAVEDGTIEASIETIEREIGPIQTAVYNLGAQIGNRTLEDTSLKTFELGWRMGTFGLIRMAKVLCPLMAKRGTGNILVTSATAAVRGNSGQHSHAAAMGGRRMFCQTLNAQYAPAGIHVAHILIDGAVDAPDTLGKMLGPDLFRQLQEKQGGPRDGLLLPKEIAETYFHIAQQHRSAWTHEIDLRAWSDTPWWNHD